MNVNNYTGAETTSRTDMSYGGSRMPASISFTHNQTDVGVNIGYGDGWRSNYAQTVESAVIMDTQYYKWTDGDGTRIYFYSDNGTWKDESGQGYILTVGSSGYDITDRDQNRLHFDSAGRLTELVDGKVSGNKITVTYTGSGSQIASVKDGAGRTYAFTYSGNTLSRVAYRGHGSSDIKAVSYGYTDGNLTSVSWADGKSVSYSYDSGKRLSAALDIESSSRDQVNVSYTAKGKVKSLTAKDGSTTVTSASFTYGDHWTKVTDNVGRWCTYQFNNYGNTTSIYNQDGQALYGSYSTAQNKPKNQLITSSRLQDTVMNLLGNDRNRSAAWSTSITVEAGKSYTLSGVLSGAGALSLSAGGVTASSESAAAGQRAEVMLTVPAGTSSLTLSGPGASELQLERAESASRYNMLLDTDMTNVGAWTGIGTSAADGAASESGARASLDAACLKLTGEATVSKWFEQLVPVNGAAGDHYTFGCWVKPGSVSLSNTNAPGFTEARRCGILVQLCSGSSIVAQAYVGANPACPEWQFLSGSVQANGAYDRVKVCLMYNLNANTSYFDGVQLFRERFAYVYSYDSAGRVSKITDLDGRATSYTYRGASGDVASITLPGGASYTYSYTASGLLTGSVSATGVTTSHSYDGYGNATQTSISYSGNTGPVIQSNNSYTADGNLPASTTTGDRNTVTYAYDTDLSLLNSTTDALGNSTANTYDTLGRVTRSESGSAWVQYAYAEDRLSTITHSGGTNTAYNFAYTTGGLTGSVTVGSRQLVTNSYNPGTWTLSGQSYGNGQSWSYTYNNADQITSRSDGTNTWRYYYNSEGALGRVERYSGQTKTGALRNYYDSADRLIRVVEQDGSGAVVHEYAWTYDSNDKVTSLTEKVNGESFSYTYGYNGDMAAQSMGGTAARNFTYDGFGRLSRTDTDNILTTDYSYRSVNAGGVDYTTTQIATVQNTYGGASRSLNYTYDNNGNILTVSDGTNTTSYSYDAQGQLVWEYNEGAGKAWQYTYDSGGNILSRTSYTYANGQTSDAQTVSYTYGDTGWGDLLTAYNGQSISYDGIGNMTSYGGWSLGWSGGRRLSTMSRDGTSLLFAYNDEGQRTEKTVNGSTHKYLYRGGLLIADICGNDALYFRYDQNGEVIGFLRTLGVNRAEYRYVKNQQGDVVAVIDFAGAEAATYTYDGWGNVLTTGGYDANLAARNPLRYRGYYYDSETELYYVTSRYYNPEMGRFICADGYATTYNSAAGANMFAYCLNSTILFRDDQGTRRVMVDVGVETYGPNGRATANLHAELTGEEDKTWIVSGGVEAGISFGLRFSISFQYVWDSEKGIDVVTTFFIGAGTPNAYIGGNVSVARGKSIDDLAGAAWDVGGGSTRLLGLGVDIQDGGGTLSASKSLFPYEMHGGVALTTVTSATDLLYIQDDMAKYGGGMYQ